VTEIQATDVRAVIRSQYHAALEMLRQTIAKCPEALWLDASTANRYWQVAYHSLFYVHLYVQPSEHDFTAWPKHRADYNYLGPKPRPPHDLPEIGEPYAQQDVLEYLDFCRAAVDAGVASMDLGAPSGFAWLPFGKLEQQLYSIRHLQQHVGELSGRLYGEAGVEIDWVDRGTVPAAP
jgi:hypothetical protein